MNSKSIFLLTLYNVVLYGLYPLLTLWGKLIKKSWYRRHFTLNDSGKKLKEKKYLFHCVSVGEVQIALRLIRSANIDSNSHISYMNPMAREVMKNQEIQHSFLPLDYLHLMRRFQKIINYRKIFVIERDIWPNLLYVAEKNKVIRYWLNADFRPQELLRIKRWRFFISIIYCFEYIFCINLAIEKQIKSILLPSFNVKGQKIHTFGNLKYFFFEMPKLTKKQDNLLLLISTHANEEEKLLIAFANFLAKNNPEARKKKNIKHWKILIFPRHINRSVNLLSTLKKSLYQDFYIEQVQLYSKLLLDKNFSIDKWLNEKKISNTPNCQVLIIDQMGLVQTFLKKSSLAFVGDTLINSGAGHNILEPLTHGAKVFYGPYLQTFSDIKVKLEQQSLAVKIEDPPKKTFENLLNNHLANLDKKKDLKQIKDFLMDLQMSKKELIQQMLS